VAVFVKNHGEIQAELSNNELIGRVRPSSGPGSVR